MSPTDLDDRLRAALHDLDARAAHSPRTRRVAAPPRRSALLPVLAAVAVFAVLLGVATLVRADPPEGLVPADGPAVSATPAPAPEPTNASTGPSQSPADARRDRIHPAIAALPFERRTGGGASETTTPEGSWVLVTPDTSALPTDVNGCLMRTAAGPGYGVCGGGYTEILLLENGSKVLRAFPFPGFHPTWMTVTDDAVYCGRTGDGGVPEGFLCRIDRKTFELTARAYACDLADCGPWDAGELASWPGRWSQGTRVANGGFDAVEERPDGDLDVLGADGEVTLTVDARTLLER